MVSWYACHFRSRSRRRREDFDVQRADVPHGEELAGTYLKIWRENI
jgi:hypothetical protein